LAKMPATASRANSSHAIKIRSVQLVVMLPKNPTTAVLVFDPLVAPHHIGSTLLVEPTAAIIV